MVTWYAVVGNARKEENEMTRDEKDKAFERRLNRDCNPIWLFGEQHKYGTLLRIVNPIFFHLKCDEYEAKQAYQKRKKK